MIVDGIEHWLADCPTLIAGERDGVAAFTYGDNARPPELLLLHALRRDAGVGSALIAAVANELRERGKSRLLVTTSNDNTAALRFYQRRGFRLHALRIGAVDAARLRKPAIPLIGFDGIPLRDEIDLLLEL
jgi:GNAT superfamily N-acetyltransferase